MMNKRVVFVLGAGASIAYGYPSGKDLIEKLLRSDAVLDQILFDNNFLNEDIRAFQKALLLASPPSIDSFLEHREDFVDLGKMMIAAAIMRCENPKSIYRNDDHWYPMLLDKLNRRFEDLDFSNVSIITFNYDRSLEEFLFVSLCNRHTRDCSVVANRLKQLRIIHVYGSLGPLEWQERHGREYAGAITAFGVKNAAEQIKVISHGSGDSREFKDAFACLSSADRIIFLGMAYHPENMIRLRFPLTRKHGCLISSSMFNMTEWQQKHFRGQHGFDHIGQRSEKCVEFLNNCPDFLALTE